MEELQLVQNLQLDPAGFIIFNSNLRINISDIGYEETITVDSITEHRAHLISLSIYSTTQFADLILLYNCINNPFYLPIGTILKIPNLTDIQSKILIYNQQNTVIQNSHITLQNQLTSKDQKSNNVIRSDGRLIFSKSNN